MGLSLFRGSEEYLEDFNKGKCSNTSNYSNTSNIAVLPQNRLDPIFEGYENLIKTIIFYDKQFDLSITLKKEF